MSNYSLTAQSPLQGLKHNIKNMKNIEVSELIDHALVSISIPEINKQEITQSIEETFKTKLPAIGKVSLSEVNSARLMGMQNDQYFALFEYQDNKAVDYLTKKINDKPCFCDQSDSWAMLNISGENSVLALERICPIDLHQDFFPIGSVARTIMEHLAVIVLREDEDKFLLLSPRSSADSFYHAIVTSIENC